MKREWYKVEITDTFCGEANYAWVRSYRVKARSIRGAMAAVARQYRGGFRLAWERGDDARYNLRGACVCAFVSFDDSQED